MSITSSIWPLEPHTHAKHVILRKYLDAWLPKLTKWHGRVIIFDGFAGPGVYSEGEDGSPVIAIKTLLEHSYKTRITAEVVYLFIELDKARHDNLCEVVEPYREQLPKAVIAVRHSDCDTELRRILEFMDKNDEVIAPTFAFIDPFGINGVSLSTLIRLMQHKSCEIFVTFMMSSLQRFLEEEQLNRHCDDFFGCPDWRAALPMAGHERETYLRTLYQRRLHDADGVAAKYVRFFTMKSRSNVTIYDLFFATNSPDGIDAMKAAMWKVDKGGTYTFSDATDPNQTVLFEPEPNWEQLLDILFDRFGATTQRWPVVQEAIRNTPFKIPKAILNQKAKSENARLEIINPPGAGRAFKDHTKVRFIS